MKKQLIITIAALCITISGFTQNTDDVQTLIGKNTRVGVMLSLENQFANFDNHQAIYAGTRIGMTFNRYLFVGIGAYGVTNNVVFKELVDNDDVALKAGYGGLSIEPILFPKKVVHLSFPMFVGLGAASYHNFNNWGWNVDDDLFWMYQAGANVEMNVLKWMKLSFGAYYSVTDELTLVNTNRDLLEGISLGGSLKFGIF